METKFTRMRFFIVSLIRRGWSREFAAGGRQQSIEVRWYIPVQRSDRRRTDHSAARPAITRFNLDCVEAPSPSYLGRIGRV